MNIPNRIAAIRKRAGLSQTQLAEAVGATLSMVGKLERGERALNSNWLMRISSALKCRPHELLHDDNDFMEFGIADADGAVIVATSGGEHGWRITEEFKGLSTRLDHVEEIDGFLVRQQVDRSITCSESLGITIPAGSRLIFSWQEVSHPPTIRRLAFIGAFLENGYIGIIGSAFPGSRPGRHHIMPVKGELILDARIDVLIPITAIVLP
ncbi:helix-turn-helix domain-containing protein [Sphingobium sp. CAP-1]|uniref:helix-turn-helix domain-containing protein n=1 Tax=Sphingobium sp. CAP-1 TaxID=2676077 RepID=UPI0018AD16F6|nr:helix-turn-helix transcriptional regulator [Sphingobium sp. CAP-1]